MFSVWDTVKLIMRLVLVVVVVVPLSADSVQPTPEHAGYDRSRSFKNAITRGLKVLGTANLACRVGWKLSYLDVHVRWSFCFAMQSFRQQVHRRPL